MDCCENEGKTVLEAETVYLLMKKGFPISRNARVQWILEHLDTVVDIQLPDVECENHPELEIVSVIPKDASNSWTQETRHHYSYNITSATAINFIAHKYRMVFSLDLSPSLATVDIQHGEIVMDEVYLSTKRCLEGITRPFIIPGTKRVMQPEIYVTVIAHTPFFTNPAQQVLVQGWLVNTQNVDKLMQVIEKQLNLLEEKVAHVTGIINLQQENQCSESDTPFKEGSSSNGKTNTNNMSTISMTSPETTFVNMLRYGMLALTLLPEHSCAHLVVVTDGIVGMNDVHVLDSILQQLRATTIACSFLHVGSSYHPNSASGLVSYPDLLRFIASATLGSYSTFVPRWVPIEESDMNTYHTSFLCWKLYRSSIDCETISSSNNWHTRNELFYGDVSPPLLRKKQVENKVTCTLSSLLCCRLREGYLIKEASIRDGNLEICFVLPWKNHVFLEYFVCCPWATKSLAICNSIEYTVTIEAPYEFLHDITCLSKKPLKSEYRHSVVSRFWALLKSLSESNSMLAHFSWFPGMSWTWYNVPDTIKNGMPVFYLPSSTSNSIQFSDAACPQFGKIWQPVISLEPNQWSRWMHCQRITLILSHDRPLTKHLHQANQSGRFQCVQYRQAAAVLHAMLKNWATFVLVENHTFVQFIYKEPDKPPVSFSLINITSKALCFVLNVAFAGGTEGTVRYKVMTDLREKLSKLTMPSRRNEQKITPCCVILHKPLEKILIRYERMPADLSAMVFPDGSQLIAKNTAIPGNSYTTTLSRYLYHTRWLWLIKKPLLQTIPGIVLPRLSVNVIARILATITKMRLSEGFNFAYSASGIINMVLEVQMRGPGSDALTYPCLVQYILFPPHVVVNPSSEKESASDDDTDEGDGEGANDDNTENSGDFEIVSEIWIEPQCGHVQIPNESTNQKAAYMHSLQYHELLEAIMQSDEECINALLTLEYLSLMCQVLPSEKNCEILTNQGIQQQLNQAAATAGSIGKFSKRPIPSDGLPASEERIRSTLFDFDVLDILPKCQQAELLFSMFDNVLFADSSKSKCEDNANRNLMEGLLHHIKYLHNKELILSSTDSQKFAKMLFERPRDESAKTPLFDFEKDFGNGSMPFPRWRCFVKGISVTHVIITFLPASENDVYLMTYPVDEDDEPPMCTPPVFSHDESGAQYEFKNTEIQSIYADNESSRSGEVSPNQSAKDIDMNLSAKVLAFSTPKTEVRASVDSSDQTRQRLVLPIYVYDCVLASLTTTLVEKINKNALRHKDIYDDHTFIVGSIGDTREECRKDFIRLKSDGQENKASSPEPKSEDSDQLATDQRNLIEHCKILSLAHCDSYVVAVYKALVNQQLLTYEDMEAAVEQCEESLIEINITNYLNVVCKHSSLSTNLEDSLENTTCNDVHFLHNLIKETFERIINVAFRAVPVHQYFYFCLPSWNLSERLTHTESHRSLDRDDEDMEALTFSSELNDSKDKSGIPERRKKLSSTQSMDSFVSDDQESSAVCNEQPLFLQLSCSIHSKTSLASTPVKLLPTCYSEIVQKLDDFDSFEIPTDLVTLDLICLYLPKEVLKVSIDHTPGLRTTSYCSGGVSPSSSLPTENDSSGLDRQLSDVDHLFDRVAHLSVQQQNAISNLVEEIQWLLEDETATAYLDHPSPTEETLNFVAKHVFEAKNRTSCYYDEIPLHFVYPSQNSAPRFLEELKNLKIDRYKIQEENSLFYFVRKNVEFNSSEEKSDFDINSSDKMEESFNCSLTKKQDSLDPPGYQSEISSLGDCQVGGTDDGYEGDSEDECHWLYELEQKRKSLLPNFWLILRVESTHVNVYFHCRFLELTSSEVDRYMQVQKMVVAQIKAICRRVNQYLLLTDLHDTRTCDLLLEMPESGDEHSWKENLSSSIDSAGTCESSSRSPGMFQCPVVWKVPFCLHHRLKTGPGKSGFSRGIKALHAVLNRFSVNNRVNMFVYQESNGNVFYLRLHEQTSDQTKPIQNKLSESDERLVVSRSSSVASLSRGLGHSSELSSSLLDNSRPRVQSFGEKEFDVLNKSGDSIVLMVHGISEVGPEVRCDLVQVLQNRLDDAVLEVLSIMLARNPMCKLTPSDVHFIQRPYRAPESIIQLSVQPYYVTHMGALGYYLRQNILQFLYTPKYTDPRAYSHFQDYSQPDGSSKRVPESDIFLYNQSHSAAHSGSRGIACIAVAIVNAQGEPITIQNNSLFQKIFFTCPKVNDFHRVISTTLHDAKSETAAGKDEVFIEFRIWKQGRVNLESLVQKLKAAVWHANWDLVTEYCFLPTSLTEPYTENVAEVPNHCYQFGEKGKLQKVYHTTLSYWFQFALEMSVPAVKKHVVTLERRHSLPVILKELQNLVHSHASDTATRTFAYKSRQPFYDSSLQDDILTSEIKPGEATDCRWLTKAEIREARDDLIFLPSDVTKDNQDMYIKNILIARNFNQWKASCSSKIDAEHLIPKDQKLLQKFNPLILDNTFVPRQRLLLAQVQNESIILFMYNWSKERSEKLVKQVTNLGTWLSSRSILYSNIIMQKIGIFHHRPTKIHHESSVESHHGGSQWYQIADVDSLAKFPHATQQMDGRARSQSGKTVSWNQLIGQILRDARPTTHHPPTMDPIVKAAHDFQELRHRDKKAKDDVNRLYTIWQSRGAVPNVPVVPLNTLNTFKQHSRLIHYCHTPLLFLPSWRLQTAATRDHSLTPPPYSPQHQCRSRAASDGATKSKINSEWHMELCASMLSEYKLYLQELGFNPITVENPYKTEDESNQVFYLKKSMLGGLLLFEMHFSEPFFTIKLRVIESSRLQVKTSIVLVNQFMQSFLDACDKIKVNMHLHSFTYDFHLRCIHSYIAAGGSLKHGYHLTNFLDDFLKYYSKAPNYARNLVYSGIITINNLITPGQTLYSYLLSHEKMYGMQVFNMFDESGDSENNDYVLVKLQSTPLVSYCDAHDTKYFDDFDVALIVSCMNQYSQQREPSDEITLKYYLMLTSKRELYPKRENENKLGKFRTVHSVIKSVTNSQIDTNSEISSSSQQTMASSYLRKNSKSELVSSSASDNLETNLLDSLPMLPKEDETDDSDEVNNSKAPTPPPVPDSPLTRNILNSPTSTSNLMHIRRESINYMGYYSSHEQLMQQLIMSQAFAAREHVTNMIVQGSKHCRTHLLWNKLLEPRSTMTYAEFVELKSLACVESLSRIDPQLTPLTTQSVTWYQSLATVLQNKYQEYHKQFISPDGNISHHLVLHQSYVQAFMLLTIDLHEAKGELNAVYRRAGEVASTPFTVNDIYSLIEGFVNACCFHLWVGLYSQ